MWESKHYVEIRRVNDFCPALIYPDFFVNSLAVRAIPVAAGIIVNLDMSTFCTLTDGIPQSSGFTIHDGSGSFFLYIGLKKIRITIIRIRKIPNLLYLRLIHGRYLPSYQRGLGKPKGCGQTDAHKLK